MEGWSHRPRDMVMGITIPCFKEMRSELYNSEELNSSNNPNKQEME
jgi:hypothetical protein